MHISTVNILRMVTEWTKIINAKTESHMWPFDLHTYIWPWPILTVKVKFMYILTKNILQMVTDRTKITIANTESRM